MPPPPAADAPIITTAAAPAAAAVPAINFDDKWHGELNSRTVQPSIGNGIQQAEILEWAVQAAAVEIEGVTAIKTRRTVRGRAGTVVIEADFQKDGQSVERRDIALCNEARGAPLADEIKMFLRTIKGARPVLVRPRGGRLPRSGRFIAPLIRDAEEMHVDHRSAIRDAVVGAARVRTPFLPQFQGCRRISRLAARVAAADDHGLAF